jgi:predicted RNase H-like HicB family nuclease
MGTGMMSVMEGMAEVKHGDEEPDLSLEEMVAAFDEGEPVELVRPARKLVVEYRYEDGAWRATSPKLRGFEVSGSGLHETRQLVRAALQGYLDQAVELDEHVPESVDTQGTSRSTVLNAPSVVAKLSTSSPTRTAISPTRLVSV